MKYYQSKKGTIGSYEDWKKWAVEFYKYIGYITEKRNDMPKDWFKRTTRVLGLVEVEHNPKEQTEMAIKNWLYELLYNAGILDQVKKEDILKVLGNNYATDDLIARVIELYNAGIFSDYPMYLETRMLQDYPEADPNLERE